MLTTYSSQNKTIPIIDQNRQDNFANIEQLFDEFNNLKTQCYTPLDKVVQQLLTEFGNLKKHVDNLKLNSDQHTSKMEHIIEITCHE